jgi:hypothetical protein
MIKGLSVTGLFYAPISHCGYKQDKNIGLSEFGKLGVWPAFGVKPENIFVD